MNDSLKHGALLHLCATLTVTLSTPILYQLYLSNYFVPVTVVEAEPIFFVVITSLISLSTTALTCLCLISDS